jgi:hypothetical protein
VIAGLFGDGAGQGFVIGGVAEQYLRRVEAGKGRVMFEVVKEMRDRAGLIHESSLTDREKAAGTTGRIVPARDVLQRPHRRAERNHRVGLHHFHGGLMGWRFKPFVQLQFGVQVFSSACMVDLLDDIHGYDWPVEVAGKT